MAVQGRLMLERFLVISTNLSRYPCLQRKSWTQWHRHRRWFCSQQPIVGEVVVEYQRGLPVITLPLPSRREQCQFTLKPISHSVGDLIRDIRREDHGIDRISIRNLDGVRISSSNSIESLMMSDFCLMINDILYKVSPPPIDNMSSEKLERLSDVKCLVNRLYETLNVDQHQLQQEKQLLSQLETLKQEIAPLETKKLELAKHANDRNNIITWVGISLMGVQFGILARLTWWEYSWDIMEPVTYFITYGTSMMMYGYFVLTRQEYNFPEMRDRQFLITFHKRAKKIGLDVEKYNELKDAISDVESQIYRLRDPLQIHLPIQEIPPSLKYPVSAKVHDTSSQSSPKK